VRAKKAKHLAFGQIMLIMGLSASKIADAFNTTGIDRLYAKLYGTANKRYKQHRKEVLAVIKKQYGKGTLRFLFCYPYQAKPEDCNLNDIPKEDVAIILHKNTTPKLLPTKLWY
jgi:hypothetical protein